MNAIVTADNINILKQKLQDVANRQTPETTLLSNSRIFAVLQYRRSDGKPYYGAYINYSDPLRYITAGEDPIKDKRWEQIGSTDDDGYIIVF